MIRYNEDIIRAIEELIKISDESSFVDFINKEFSFEYSSIFQKESEERARNATSIYGEDFDTRKYVMYLFKNEMLSRFGINQYYSWLSVLKVIVFYENILTLLDNKNRDNLMKNKKIYEMRYIYEFFKDLTSKKPCIIANHMNAITTLNLSHLTQAELNDDMHQSIHDLLARKLLGKYLEPFLLEYLNMIKIA